MTARTIIVPGAMPSRDSNGRSLPAKFRFYLPNTTTPTSVYTDNTLTVAHPFPLLSDAAGRWPTIWADDSLSFDVGWSDQVFDETIETFANISPAADAALNSVAQAQSYADMATAEATAAAASAAQSAASASQSAASAIVAAAAALGLKVEGTSASNVNVAAATPTFQLDQAGLQFSTGMDVVAALIGDEANTRLVGTVTAWDGLRLTLASAFHTGVGSHVNWRISLTAIGGVASVAGLSGVITAAAAKAALAIQTADISDYDAQTRQRALIYSLLF